MPRPLGRPQWKPGAEGSWVASGGVCADAASGHATTHTSTAMLFRCRRSDTLTSVELQIGFGAWLDDPHVEGAKVDGAQGADDRLHGLALVLDGIEAGHLAL